MGLAARVSAAEGLVLTLLAVAFPQLVVSMVGITDPSLAEAARTAVRIVSLGLVGTAFVMLLNSYYTFCVREGLAVGVTALATFVLPVALAPAAGWLFGECGVWSALAASPYAAIGLVAVYVAIRCGRRAFPLFLDRARIRASRVYDLVLDTNAICDASATVGRFLGTRRGMDDRKSGLVSLLIEETLMLVKDRNAGRRTHAEISVDWSNGITVVIRDDGKLFDITDADSTASSLRSYLVANLMVAIPARRNMTTTGFNRNMFKL
jgi:hypothetical protein